MIRLISLLLLLSSFTSFKPLGSGTAYLTCRSASGRTVLKAELQDIAGLLEKAELSVDGNKLIFTEEDEAFTIFDPQAGVFTVYIRGKENEDFPNGRFIQLWCIPRSFKTIQADHTYHTYKYEFKAKMEATEPRKDRDLRIPQVLLNCTLEYKL